MALADDWNIITGSWVIVSGRLFEPGTLGAKIICKHPVPADSAGEMKVSVTICDPSIGDEYYIYLACELDGSGGDWVQYKYTALNTWRVTLSTGEFTDQTFAPVVSGETPVMGCIDSNGFLMGSVANSGDEHPWSDGGATGAGRYAGLGLGTTAAGGQFDNFQIEELRNGTEICTTCMCTCCGVVIKKQLTITFVSASGWAACLGGESTTLDWEWDGGAKPWLGDITINNGYGDNLWTFRLECEQSADPDCTGQNFSLEMVSQCAAGCYSPNCSKVPIAASSHCSENGFHLVFGPYQYESTFLSCDACGPWTMPPVSGSYYLEVTF